MAEILIIGSVRPDAIAEFEDAGPGNPIQGGETIPMIYDNQSYLTLIPGDRYESAFQASDPDDSYMLENSGCGHAHETIVSAANCAVRRERRLAGPDGRLTSLGVARLSDRLMFSRRDLDLHIDLHLHQNP